MQLIDTHTHLYLPEFKDDLDKVIERAIAAGIERFYLPAISNKHIKEMLALEKAYPEHCFAMIGLHPCSIKDNYKEELKIVEQWLQQRKFAAVGEIGLDFYWDKTYTVQQYEAFHTQIEWALQHNMPIVIHSRNATHETIDVLKQYTKKDIRGIFHCFGGTIQEAESIIECGFLLGIGGVVTYKNAGLAEVVQQIPLEHIVLETDAPYLTPVPFRGKRNESSYLIYTAEKIAHIKNITLQDIAAITTTNAQQVFGGSNRKHLLANT